MTTPQTTWTPFDYADNDANPLPDRYWMVFVVEHSGAHRVTVGWWADDRWEVPGLGKHCSVSHWAPIQLPDPPPLDPPAAPGVGE